MALGDEDDNGLKLLALLGAGVLALLIVQALCASSSAQCPEGSYACADSPCGCCVQNADGSVDICKSCSGYAVMDGKCCSLSNPQDCASGPAVCVAVEPCKSDSDCCAGSKCEGGDCKGCEQGAYCDEQNPCCSGMSCFNGKCAACEAKPCMLETAAKDCCSGYECYLGKCTSCEKACNPGEPGACCDGWACISGSCKNCVASCNPLQGQMCACDGFQCVNGKCAGCKEGAYCDENNPCCNGYACNFEKKVCESCEKSCSKDSECCAGGVCVMGSCEYTGNCEGAPCTNPGEPCELCSTGSDKCSKCTDNTVCAAKDKSANEFVCKPKGGCSEGQVACDTAECPTGCCDAFTGQCACGEGGHPCKTVQGCTCCTYGTQTVSVCPPNTFKCPQGCTGAPMVGDSCMVFDTPSGKKEFCHAPPNLMCEWGTFACTKDPSKCCIYIVPNDGLPAGALQVPPDICKSGYAYVTKGTTLLTYVCLRAQYEKLGPNNHKYTFYKKDGSVFGVDTSMISPYEYIVSNYKEEVGGNFCTKLEKFCLLNKINNCFTAPKEIVVG
ncbi:MAG: hypothetical protein QXU54_00905 [Candidatus Micrarchaeia archaeon]